MEKRVGTWAFGGLLNDWFNVPIGFDVSDEITVEESLAMKRIAIIGGAIIAAVLIFGGVVTDFFKQRPRQKSSLTKTFLLAVANYVREWALSSEKLPATLEETNGGKPWADGCGNPLEYQVIRDSPLEFAISSRCGGSQTVRFRIEGTNLIIVSARRGHQDL